MTERPSAHATYVRLPVDLHERAKTYAAENDLSLAQVIRAALRGHLANAPSLGVSVNVEASPRSAAAVANAVANAVKPRDVTPIPKRT